MLRWLVLAVLLVLLGALAEARLRRLLGGGDRHRTPRAGAPRAVREAELVACAACGLHRERSRAVRGAGGLYFCSTACAERAS